MDGQVKHCLSQWSGEERRLPVTIHRQVQNEDCKNGATFETLWIHIVFTCIQSL